MELVRLTDKYDIIRLETIMAQYIRNILKHNPHLDNTKFHRKVNTNTFYLIPEYIASTTLLPREHPVRSILAAASVEGFLRSKYYKFSEEVYAYPSFGINLLLETRLVLYKVEESHRTATFKNPISG